MTRSSDSVLFAVLLVPVATLVLAHPNCAQGQDWSIQFGTAGHDDASSLVADGLGGIFVCGGTEGSLGGASAGETDAYVARFDADGNRLWITQFGSEKDDYAAAVALDGAGGVYVCGTTRSDRPSSLYGGGHPFLARFNADGSLEWMAQSDVLSALGEGYALAPSGDGGVFLGGSVMTLPSTGGTGWFDGFVALFDAGGNEQWTQFVHSGGDLFLFEIDAVYALATDGRGGVFAGGKIAHNSKIPLVRKIYPFVGRFSGSGERRWLHEFSDPGNAIAVALTPDRAGGVYVAGETPDLVGGSSSGGIDAFSARYNRAGHLVWLMQFGSTETDKASGVTSDSRNAVRVVGSTMGAMNGPNIGNGDIFLTTFGRSGKPTKTTQFGSAGLDVAQSISSDREGNIFVSGSTYGNVGGNPHGGRDAFVVRFGSPSDLSEAGTCAADWDTSTGVGVLDIFDFLCFQDAFVANDPYACDCDTSTGQGVCDIFDFLCFQNAFDAGCP